MKIVVGQTYYYKDFITVDEQLFLRDWALRNEEYLIPNPSGPYRKRVVLNKIPEYPNVLNDLKDRLIRLENISNSENIITNGEQDIVSLQRNMGVVPEHTDYDRIEGYYLRRYNIFISLPEKGGLPVYGGEIINVKERCVLKVDAGLIPHSTTIINGETPRIMLSYGFNIKRI